MKCSIHNNKEAAGKCSVCHKHFCKACLEKVGEKNICFKCLENLAKKQINKYKYSPYNSLNKYLLISIGAFAFIAVYTLFLSLPLMSEAFNDLYAPEAEAYLMLIGKFVILFIESALIYTSSSISFILGILIVIGLIVSPFIGITAPEITRGILIFHIFLPLIALIGLFAGKKGLSERKR